MHVRQAALLDLAVGLTLRVAASVLWQYSDGEGRTFYLEEKKTTCRSPYDGKSFSAKPQRMNMGDVGKDMKEKASNPGQKVLWEFTDEESGKNFWLTEKKTRVFSPWNGKSFSAKPDKDTLSEVTKDVKQDSDKAKASKKAEEPSEKTAASQEQWEAATEILEKGEAHPALKAIQKAYDEVLDAIKSAKKKNDNLNKAGAGNTEAGTLLIAEVVPKLQRLAKVAGTVGDQMISKFKSSGNPGW